MKRRYKVAIKTNIATKIYNSIDIDPTTAFYLKLLAD